jgi:hypothetical protein
MNIEKNPNIKKTCMIFLALTIELLSLFKRVPSDKNKIKHPQIKTPQNDQE